ncbi:MAG: replicative DNA helicase [Acidobacteria bacterium]|nr:replicative DNA helicase [Acidobacteriota bacterium]MBI3657208.1 replicative DNA helicase [Acidobacteriota bacterium]
MPVDITLEKTLPHNIEAERSLLGAVFLDDKLFNNIVEILKLEDFYIEAHRKIFSKMSLLSAESKGIDFVTIKNELSKSGDLEAVGGGAYLASMTDGLPRAANVEHYARIVKEKSILRRLIFLSNETMARCYESDEDAPDILEDAERTIFQIAEEQVRSGFLPIKEIIRQTFQDLEALYARKQMVTGLASGFQELDVMTSGLQPTDLIIVAARPGIGKTSFALNIAQFAAVKTKLTVGVFSLEMSASQLIKRMLCSEARIDAHKFRSGHLTKEDWGKVAVSMATISEAKLYIDDTAGLSLVELRSKARRLKAEHGLDLVIIDYLQLMSGKARFENRQQEISAISRGLKAVAKELAVPVIALSQLSRAPEMRRGDHKPQLSDLRESGSIEQDADLVMFLYREELYNPTEENQGIAEVIIAKQRNGPIGTFKLAFLREFTRFENLWKED